MSSRRSILIVFGTRPEAIKLFPVIRDLSGREGMAVRTCVTGQHREMLDQVLAVCGIAPDLDLDLMVAGQSLDALTVRLLTGVGAALDSERPDRVIVQGDTATAMASALAAYHRGIPVAHVEAGLRSGDIRHPWPEEVNRKIISAIADLHFAPTEAAADALRRENVDPAAVHATGNTVIDALLWMRDRIAAEPELAGRTDRLVRRFAGRKIVAVTTHRRENLGGMEAIAQAVRRIAEHPGAAVIFPAHPNPAVRGPMEHILGETADVALVEPLDYPDFVRLLAAAHLVLTDSGGVQEEAPAFGKPVLVMRETTERPEGVAAGTAKLIGADEDRIVAETLNLIENPAAYAAMARAHNPFGDGRAAERIGRIIAACSARPVTGSRSSG